MVCLNVSLYGASDRPSVLWRTLQACDCVFIQAEFPTWHTFLFIVFFSSLEKKKDTGKALYVCNQMGLAKIYAEANVKYFM